MSLSTTCFLYTSFIFFEKVVLKFSLLKIASLEYEYEDRFISLSIWDCGIVNPNSINQNEHDLILWLDESTLNTVKWLPADVPLIEEWMKSGIPHS